MGVWLRSWKLLLRVGNMQAEHNIKASTALAEIGKPVRFGTVGGTKECGDLSTTHDKGRHAPVEMTPLVLLGFVEA
jgi:hypothetical protein